MRKPNGFAILMILAALPAAALNWNQADPASQWKSSLSAAPAAPAAILSRPPSGGGGVAGQFDSYVLTLQWSAAFCETRPNLPECGDRDPDRFSAKNLTLHGLWPEKAGDSTHAYGYCGVDDATRALDRAATWCRMPALDLSSPTRSRLAEVMPAVASCLQNHEWYKHGSCSGFTPDSYFSQASALVAHVAGTSFGRYLSANTGRTVTADALLAAFERDFGAGSRGMVRLTCAKAGGADLLTDVRLKLTHPLRPADELGKMLLPGGGKGNCPASFKLDEL
jgi:ribonuclease T2